MQFWHKTIRFMENVSRLTVENVEYDQLKPCHDTTDVPLPIKLNPLEHWRINLDGETIGRSYRRDSTWTITIGHRQICDSWDWLWSSQIRRLGVDLCDFYLGRVIIYFAIFLLSCWQHWRNSPATSEHSYNISSLLRTTWNLYRPTRSVSDFQYYSVITLNTMEIIMTPSHHLLLQAFKWILS